MNFVPNPEFSPKFLRLARIAAEQEKEYWEDLEKEDENNNKWKRYTNSKEDAKVRKRK